MPYNTAEGAGGPTQPGIFGGWLGRNRDPLFVLKDPNAADFGMPAAVAPEYFGNCTIKNSGHTEWADGGVGQMGFTTAWAPNRAILGGPGRDTDLDIVGKSQKATGPTFAAITSRSYHPGGVNVLLGDGSVKFIKDSINGGIWRGLGTTKGREVISSDSF